MNDRIWVPSIVEEAYNGMQEINLYSRHLVNRRIFLHGEIDSAMADAVLSQLLYLKDTGEDAIFVYINSEGGTVEAGLMIYDLFQSVRAPLYLYCTGIAASMAALILAGGQEGRRFILPHAQTMLHSPSLSGGVEGFGFSSGRRLSESVALTRRTVNEIFSRHTGRTVEEIRKAAENDNYMNAEESVAFGLCDGVAEEILTGEKIL